MAKGTLKYKLYQWKDNRDENSEPMWHARAAKGTTIEFDDLVKHMSEHNSPYSQGVIKGVLTDMLACVKELVLDNKSVRLGDLGLFSIGIRSKGALTSKDWKVSSHLRGVTLNVRNTKTWSNTELRNSCTIVEYDEYTVDDKAADTEGGYEEEPETTE